MTFETCAYKHSKTHVFFYNTSFGLDPGRTVPRVFCRYEQLTVNGQQRRRTVPRPSTPQRDFKASLRTRHADNGLVAETFVFGQREKNV